MDPYERERLEYEGLQEAKPAIERLWDKAAQLRTVAGASVVQVRAKRDAMARKNPIKSSRIAEFARRRPQLPKPAKAGIGLVALLVTVVGGLLWRRRKRK